MGGGVGGIIASVAFNSKDSPGYKVSTFLHNSSANYFFNTRANYLDRRIYHVGNLFGQHLPYLRNEFIFPIRKFPSPQFIITSVAPDFK